MWRVKLDSVCWDILDDFNTSFRLLYWHGTWAVKEKVLTFFAWRSFASSGTWYPKWEGTKSDVKMYSRTPNACLKCSTFRIWMFLFSGIIFPKNGWHTKTNSAIFPNFPPGIALFFCLSVQLWSCSILRQFCKLFTVFKPMWTGTMKKVCIFHNSAFETRNLNRMSCAQVLTYNLFFCSNTQNPSIAFRAIHETHAVLNACRVAVYREGRITAFVYEGAPNRKKSECEVESLYAPYLL